MKNKFLSIMTLCLMLTLVGCSESNEVKEELKSDEKLNIEETTETEIVETKKEYLIGENVTFKANTEYVIDLNNDDIEETIIYNYASILSNATVNGNDAEIDYHVSIQVNDEVQDIEFYEPLDYFYIIDVCKDDDYFEIVVSTYGMSDDLESVWFRYDGESLINLGHTEMIPGEGIILNEDSTLIIYNRTDILETSFIPVKYEILDNQIKMIKEDFYKWNTFREGLLVTNMDLVVHTEPLEESETIIIPAGIEVDSNTTDNVAWVNIIYENNEYWLHVTDCSLIDNDNIFIYEAFSNLFLAD